MEIITLSHYKKEAKLILKGLKDIIKEFGKVTVADYNDLITARSVYTDHCKGWFDLSEARIEKADGYIRKYKIVLPDPISFAHSDFYREEN